MHCSLLCSGVQMNSVALCPMHNMGLYSLSFSLKGMMEQSKRASLSVARSILNHKLIGKKLESYLKV